MIIIEGTDLVGKSSLAKHLYAQLGMINVHMGPLPDTWQGLGDYMKLLATHECVFDRFAWSGIVYEEICGSNPCKITRNDLGWINQRIDNCEGIRVLLIASNDTLAKRYEPRKEEELFSLEQIIAVQDAFREFDSQFDYVADSTNQDFDIYKEIVSRWSTHREQTSSFGRSTSLPKT